MTEEEKIKYIKENIQTSSYLNICNFLSIHRKTLFKLIKNNNIIDERKTRKCNFCDEIILHKDVKNRIRCENQNKKCNKCMSKIKKEKYMGKGGPFFGKHHTDENKKYFSEIHKGKHYSVETEFKKGHKNGKEKSNYEYWVLKYGNDIADEKNKDFKKKLSYLNSGINNPMYGKPSPIGSGNGWSGWYNGWYFRSLLELSYMLFVIERFNLKWENGEKKKNKIPYTINGKNKNYFPDFIINNKYVIECKPKKLQNTNINIIKEKFAKTHCLNKNLIFKYVDCYKIKPEELIKLYQDGKIKFVEKYENKIKNIISKYIL